MTGEAAGAWLVVAATEREARGFRDRGIPTVVCGVGRVNAAIATTLALAADRGTASMPLVISAGIAGALPAGPDGEALPIGTVVVGSAAACVEDGILTPTGFRSMEALGFPIASFAEGNLLPADPGGRARLARLLPEAVEGPIATVATCSGTDGGAREVVARSRAVAEAMEGSGVIHAAGLLGAPAVEVRVISNTTGDRDRQVWRLDEAFEVLDRVAACLAGDDPVS